MASNITFQNVIVIIRLNYYRSCFDSEFISVIYIIVGI